MLAAGTVPVQVLSDRRRLNRADGGIILSSRARGPVKVIDSLHETGGYRVKCPALSGDPLEAVIINTGGGVAGGDRVSIAAHAGVGSRLCLTTATAERIYRSTGSAAEIDISLDVAAGGTIAWLPQATILFSGAAIRRRVVANLEHSARLLIVEATAYGRTASGERMTSGSLDDQWRMRRDGRLVFAEASRLDGDMAAALAVPPWRAGIHQCPDAVRGARSRGSA